MALAIPPATKNEKWRSPPAIRLKIRKEIGKEGMEQKGKEKKKQKQDRNRNIKREIY